MSVVTDPVFNEIELSRGVQLIQLRFKVEISFPLIFLTALCVVAAQLSIIKTKTERITVGQSVTKKNTKSRVGSLKMCPRINISNVIRSPAKKTKLPLRKSSFPGLRICRHHPQQEKI